MKRSWAWFVAAAVSMAATGCGGGGIEEGPPPDVTGAQLPAGFADQQKNMGDKMLNPDQTVQPNSGRRPGMAP